MILALIALVFASGAAAAASDGDLISGKAIAALFAAIFAGGGGIWIGRKGGESAAEKTFEKREQEIRTKISNELRAKVVNDPLHIEQSAYQATMNNNEKEHSDIFNRLRVLEAEVAGIKATITAKFDGLSAQMMETREMVRSLYEKVCNGKRK